MVNVFSFCLYGPYNYRYYPGMMQNIELVAKYFPDWKVYVYVAPDVDPEMLEALAERPNVVLRPTGVTGAINMIHRFYAIDEPEVDLMMVRDADSRIHWKDRWAVREFLRLTQFVAHTIRDNKEHVAEMMGGLWGIRKSAGLSLRAEYAAYTEDTERGRRNGHDQNFLTDVIYPKVLGRLLVHYSWVRFFRSEHAVEFPFEWTNDVYCGRVEFEHTDSPEPPQSFRVFRTPLLPQLAPISTSLATSTAKATPVPSPPTQPPPLRPEFVPPILKFLHRK